MGMPGPRGGPRLLVAGRAGARLGGRRGGGVLVGVPERVVQPHAGVHLRGARGSDLGLGCSSSPGNRPVCAENCGAWACQACVCWVW